MRRMVRAATTSVKGPATRQNHGGHVSPLLGQACVGSCRLGQPRLGAEGEQRSVDVALLPRRHCLSSPLPPPRGRAAFA